MTGNSTCHILIRFQSWFLPLWYIYPNCSDSNVCAKSVDRDQTPRDKMMWVVICKQQTLRTLPCAQLIGEIDKAESEKELSAYKWMGCANITGHHIKSWDLSWHIPDELRIP